jgi:mono/diheme cytochrome c family protein
MKKVIKRVAAAIGSIVALGILVLVVKFYVLAPSLRAPSDVKAPTTPEAIARGKYLVESVTPCLTCHSPIREEMGSAVIEATRGQGREFPMEGFPGRVITPNLTSDKETGLGSWTDGEILRAMREGVSRDGRALFPLMPYTTYASELSDDDALAVVAFLRTLAPQKHEPGRTTLDFPVSMFIRAAPKPLENSAAPAPSSADPLARGNWLLRVSLCAQCHNSVDERRRPLPGKSFAGGQKFAFRKGEVVYSANITSDPATGIGSYTDDDILRVLDEGTAKNGRKLWVMPWATYKGMTLEDKRALIVALRAVPPVSNTPPSNVLK